MVSFWPSLGLLLFFLVTFLKCRAIGARVTLPLGGFLPFFAYGAVGATLLSLLLEQMPLFQFPLVENSHLLLVAPAAWLSGPAIEELAKALPIFVLAFVGTTSRRLTIADLTLAGFASGAGFGFVEANFQVLAGGAFPDFNWLSTDFDTVEQVASDYSICFAGHAVYTGLIALVAASSVRFLPFDRVYTWIPAAFAFVLVFFDHTMFNWKMLHPGLAIGGNFIEAPNTLESLYALTLHGRLETWLLPAGLIAAQIAEAWFCANATGKRPDLLLPREWRGWVINEWLVVILRLPLGRAAVQHTLVYFRRRRALALTTLEAKRNPDDRALASHVRFLERRLDREREFLVSPPAGTWLLPRSVWLRGGMNYAWRSRWVFAFAALFTALFMFGPKQLPQFVQPLLRDDTTTSVLVALAFGFTAWQGYRFWRAAQPDAGVGESTAQAMYQARMFLLGASVVGALCPALALLLGWKALVPGAAYISSYFSLWIAQGGSPFALMALASIGGAIDADPAPTGHILRDEMAAANERIRRLERHVAERAAAVLASLDPSTVQEPTGGARGIAGMMGRVLRHDGGSGPTLVLTEIFGSRSSTAPAHATPLDRTLGEFVDLMAKLDADRDAQERRKLLLDEFERQAAETRGDDLSLAIQSVQQEFEGLAAGLQIVATKELARMAAFEQAYSKAWAQAMRELDAYDGIRREVKEPLRLFWEPAKDDVWAVRVAAITDERALPLQAILLPELEAFAAEATTEDAETLKAAIERIRATQFDAREQLEEPAAEPQAAEDWQPAELESGSQQDEISADVAEDSDIQPAADVTEDDALALERFDEESQHVGTVEETDEAPVQSETTDGAAEFYQHEAPVEHPEEDLAPAAAEIPAAIPPDAADERDELQRLLDTIKRDSGYLATVKISETAAPVAEESPPEPAVEAAERSEPELEQLRDTIRRESGYMEPPADDADTRDLTIPYEEAVEIAEAAADDVLPEQPADDFVAATAIDHIDAAEDQLPSIDPSDISVSEAVEAPAEPIQISEDTDFPLPPELALQESVELETELAQEPAEQEPVQLDVETVDIQAISPEIVAIEEAQSSAAEIAEEPQQQTTESDAGSSEPTSAALPDGDAVISDAIADDANAEAPQEDVPPEPVPHEAAQLETVIDTSPAVVFHREGLGKAAMLDGYSMVAKATVQSAPVEELPVEDAVELAADNVEGEPQVDFEVLPDTNEQTSFEEPQLQDSSTSAETVSTAGDGWSEAAAVAVTDGGIVPIVEAPQDTESHVDRGAAERESTVLETAKGADLADFVESQLAKLSDRAPIKDAAPVVEEPKPEPTVDPEPVPAIPDPWDAEAGTLFALEPVPESIRFAPAAVDELRAAANAAEQMPLDFTAAKQRDTNPVVVDDASLPGEAVVQSGDAESPPESTPEPTAAEASPVEEVRPAPEIPVEKPTQTSLRAVVDGAKEPKDGAGLLRRVGGFFRASREKKSRNQPADLRNVINQPVAPKPDTVEFVVPEETTRNEAIVAEPVAAPTTPAVADAIAPVQPEDIVASDIDAQKVEPVRDAIRSSIDSVDSFDELETSAVRPRTDMEDESADDDHAVPAVEQILPSEEIKEQPTRPIPSVADSAPSPEPADAKSVSRDAALGTLVEQLLAHIQKAGATAPAEAAVAQQGAQASSLPDLVEQLRTQVQKLGDRPQDQAAEANADPKQVREDALANLVEQLRSEVQKSRETPVEAASLPAQEPSEAKAPLGEISLPKLEDFLRAHLESAGAPVRPAAPLPKPRAPSPPAVDASAREQKPVENAAPAGKPARSARNASKTRAKPVNEKKLPVVENTPKPEEHAPEQKTVAPPPATAKPEKDMPPQKAAAPAPVVENTPKPEKHAPEQKTIAPPPATANPEKDVPPQKAAAPAPAAETPVRLVRDIGPRGAAKVEPEKKPLKRELEGSNSGGMRPSKFFNPGQVRPDVEDVTALRKTAVEKRGTESRLSEAVGAYYAKLKLPLPPMHTTDIAGIRKIIDSGRLETPRKGPAPWSFSGVLRKGDVAIRVKAGSEKYIEFVASNETFGQIGRFYPRSIGLGAFKTFIPAEHLEYFDLTSLEWRPVKQ